MFIYFYNSFFLFLYIVKSLDIRCQAAIELCLLKSPHPPPNYLHRLSHFLNLEIRHISSCTQLSLQH